MKPLARNAKTHLTGKEIEGIILKCAQASVQEISISGLRLKFGEGGPAKSPVTGSKATKPTSPTVAALTAHEHRQQTVESIKDDEARLKEERLSLMMIEDPLEYERLIMNGELQEATEDDEEALDQ